MPTPTSGITFRTIQEAMPEYHLSQDLLHGVLTAMPPPPPDATPAWRKARLTRIIEEIAARVPMDPAQGHLAGQLVVVQFLADDMMERLMTPGLPLAERRLTARGHGSPAWRRTRAWWHSAARHGPHTVTSGLSAAR